MTRGEGGREGGKAATTLRRRLAPLIVLGGSVDADRDDYNNKTIRYGLREQKRRRHETFATAATRIFSNIMSVITIHIYLYIYLYSS